MAKKRGRESNVGLVVTLIFFILLAIGLGVSTYYGFAQQDKLTNDAKTAALVQKDAEAQRDWYQFQALTYRTYLGQTDGMDLPSDPKDKNSLTTDAQLKLLRDKFVAQQIGKDSHGEFPDKADVQKVITAMETKPYRILAEDPATKAPAPRDVTMTWDNNKVNKDGKAMPRPRYTMADIYTGVTQLLASQTKQTDDAVAAQAAAEAAKKKDDEQKDAFEKTYKDELVKLEGKYSKDLKDAQDTIAKQQKDLDTANKEKGDALQKGADDAKAIMLGVAKKDQLIKDQDAKIKDLRDQNDLEKKKQQESPSNGEPIATDWKIVQMDRSGKQPFVNLGTIDNVRPGLTFSIHGRGPDGHPLLASKGTLEVIDVVNDHLSQAQVVSVKDAQKDPILPGDFLYNPIFKPGADQHVFLAGRVDLHGSKVGDDFEEFQRLLRHHNVVVDGYLDPQDGSVKGKMNVTTDYLVLGDVDTLKDVAADNVKKLQEQARSNGVRIIRARDFLDSMGYKVQ